MIIRFVCVLNLMCRADTVQTMCHFYNSSQNFPVSSNCKLPIGWEGRYVSKSCQANVLYTLWPNYMISVIVIWISVTSIMPRWKILRPAHPWCLGHHLEHVWGIIWDMSGAVLGNLSGKERRKKCVIRTNLLAPVCTFFWEKKLPTCFGFRNASNQIWRLVPCKNLFIYFCYNGPILPLITHSWPHSKLSKKLQTKCKTSFGGPRMVLYGC